MKKGIWVAKVIGMIVIGAILVFGFVMATMYLWNWLIPALFAGPVITFWQALGLLALSKILFSGFGRGGHRPWRGRHWKSHLKDRWSSMTPEERERLKEKMRGKWCMRKEDGSASEAGQMP
ncbi:MAG: hypothetical protein WAZ98_12705 [Cyclobacteriaceae bacterium]